MTKVSLGALIAAAALIVVATYFNMPVVAGGSGVVLLVGLGYAFVVARRDEELSEAAVDHGTQGS